MFNCLMKYKYNYFLLPIFLVLAVVNTNCFIFNTLKEIAQILDSLTEFNQEMRTKAVTKIKELGNFSGSKKGLEDDFLKKFPEKLFLRSIKDKEKEKEKKRGFQNIAGFIPEDITEVVEFLRYPEKFVEIGAKMPKGLLLVGPPGTGKTSIARAIAEEANAKFFNASATEFIELYVGAGPKKIRELFDRARASGTRAIIFIDEIDAIGGSRSGETNSEYRNTLNELLNQMDGFTQNNFITVIGATNTPESIDAALKRPGRFDKIIFIDLPNFESRIKILTLYSQDIKYEQVDFLELAKKTDGFSPAEIKNLVNEAAILAVRQKAKIVKQSHFIKGLNNLKKQKLL